MFNYSEKCQKSGVFFLVFDGFQRPRSFRLVTSRITKTNIFFDLVKLKIDQGFQKCITSWVFDQ